VIAPDGSQLGIKPTPEALRLAQEQDLDLVEVAPLANPPVCRIMDYRKWQYEEKQRAKESRKKATNISIKEMKYRPKIGSGDFDTKTRKVAEFLGEGHKVKITIMFRGREMQHPELGMKILEHVADEVTTVGKIEAAPKVDGRNMIMVLAPEKKAKPATPKAPHKPTQSTATTAAASTTPTETTPTAPTATVPTTTTAPAQAAPKPVAAQEAPQ
jgi:translation initiation factor IF-3